MGRSKHAGFGLAAGVTMLGTAAATRGDDSKPEIALGVIGTGKRGTWIANLFKKHGGYRLAACADYFEDRVDAFGDRFGIDSSRRFTGLSGYKRLLEQKLDAVVIESPPLFHPEQAMAAVEAGKHVFLAKPIAVDVPGCLTVEEAGRKATESKRCFLVDFQTRTSDLYREAVSRVHRGDIGPIVSGEAQYLCGPTWGSTDADLKSNAETRLRHWGVDRILSGDIITEQNIHALDVATWIVDAAPTTAYGTGGRKARTGSGDCWDHFAVIYKFPGEVVISFHSKQYGKGLGDIGCMVYGDSGSIDTHYFGEVSIVGQKPFPGGNVGKLYSDGAARNIATFHASIAAGDYSNPTVAPSVRSNLTTILGRTAAYQQREISWKSMLDNAEAYELDTAQLKS